MEALIEQIEQKLKSLGVPSNCNRPSSDAWRSLNDEISGARKVRESKELAAYIDHTLLKPEADRQGIIDLCRQAVESKFCSVCINPYWIPLAREQLKGSQVKLCTVCGFPLGADDPALKSAEAQKAVEQGADEIDMVINIGALKSGLYKEVSLDIAGAVKAAGGKTVKVIIETCLLTKEQKIEACLIARGAGAHFVKTSTGFSSGGATIEDITLMRQTVGPELGVKASGGVKTTEDALAMIKAGANRIGTSSGIKIIGK